MSSEGLARNFALGSKRCLVATLFAVTAGWGCGHHEITNPSGTCGTRSNGSRAGYAFSGDTWVPDCQSPLLREYWRTFSSSGATLPTS